MSYSEFKGEQRLCRKTFLEFDIRIERQTSICELLGIEEKDLLTRIEFDCSQ